MKFQLLLRAGSALVALPLVSPFSFPSSFTSTPIDGSTTPIYRDARQRWPRQGEDKLAVITYCYDDHATQARLAPVMRKAIQIWYDELGGPASKASGHGLVFKEYGAPASKSPWCLQNGKLWTAESGIPMDAVRVHANDRAKAVSTVGYIEDDGAETGGRHEMRLDPHTAVEGAWVFAHELGHVLGLLHEHQRVDRENYVNFKCANVQGFHETQTVSFEQNPSEDANSICTNYSVAQRYGFDAMQYIPEDNHFQTDASPTFDFNSIMLYDSKTFAELRESCNAGSTDYCVLLKWTSPAKERLEYIDTNKVPSEGDVEFVKSFYNWQGRD
ncbi:hypothetical protein BCR34DRAFT_607322 [Clohesyomyces aquaticus]|uniref:Metalloendopeptidase n=1 Tax=Clohesyomyces aquaticus TaxID=1231657 RepID=A0A1Y1YH60_9PLEO|nr:hypothetical protein BCR34DRAFT_607322 [Clohesyomyces aquaticus]